MRFKVSIVGVLVVATFFMAGLFDLNATSKAADSNLDRLRQIVVFELAASENFVSFGVVLASDTVGLIILDRRTSAQRIIYSDSTIMRSPYFSSGGDRMLFVQSKAGQEVRELVSCKISNWHCETLLKTTATIFSPVELDAETILYSSSPLVTVEP